MNIQEMLASMEGGEDRPKSILPEAQIAALREYAERYHQPNPFRVGDFVTSRQGSPYNCNGEPHLVIEVLEQPWHHFKGDNSSADFGPRVSMRIARAPYGVVSAFWVEHEWFEVYKPATEA